jgi:protein N-terminal methyltransferase
MASFSLPAGTELTFNDVSDLVAATLGQVQGEDTEGREYTSVKDMWAFELSNKRKEKKSKAKKPAKDAPASANMTDEGWYQDGLQYWESEANCAIDDDGVLQGYGALTPMDTRDSNLFVDALREARPEFKLGVAADCGAGIGRVTKNFLIHRFEKVHLVEVSPRLLASAPAYVGEEYKDRIECIVQGLQDFAPAADTYDCIWTQWVIGHLHDLDFVRFLRRCAAGLRPGGLLVLKDNCSTTCTFLVDRDDSSVNRHIEYIRLLVRLAGLNIVMERSQKDFPEELYPVMMMALSKD